jgi:predicted ABC-type ATPase
MSEGILNLDLPKSEINSYHASLIASYLVGKLFQTHQSFSFETVMSHKSKLEILDVAKSAGYKTYLYFIYTDDPELNVARVKLRALAGLHDVSPEIIRSRYRRCFELLPQALTVADKAYIINNSDDFEIIAEKQNGELSFYEPFSKKIEGILQRKI